AWRLHRTVRSGLVCCVRIALAACSMAWCRPSASPVPMLVPIAWLSMPPAMSGIQTSAAGWACCPPTVSEAIEPRSGQRAHQPPGTDREDNTDHYDEHRPPGL